MESIFKINLEPNINYESVNLFEIKNILKNLRLNISEEIKCLSFIKQNIEKNYEINKEDNFEINQKLKKKYSQILIKLNELCVEEINYISETLIILDKKIKENTNENDFENIKDSIIYNKINLTLSNYNKIVDNINKTLSSLPYIFNLYLLFYQTEDEENKFIRNNMDIAEENYKNENNKINIKKKTKKHKKEEEKEESIIKREKMIKFSESLKNINKNKKLNLRNELKIKNDENNNNIEIIKNKLQDKVKQTEKQKGQLKSFIFNNCIKENELENFMKIKEDNRILKEKIFNLKNIFQKLNNSYENQNEIFEKLIKERIYLENENLKLIEYVNNILLNKENNSNLESNKDNLLESTNKGINFKEKNLIKNNLEYNSEEDIKIINTEPNNFDSIEMLKKLSKL